MKRTITAKTLRMWCQECGKWTGTAGEIVEATGKPEANLHYRDMTGLCRCSQCHNQVRAYR